QAERPGPFVQLLEVLLVVVLLDDDQTGVGTCLVRDLRGRVGAEQDRQPALADTRCGRTDGETLGSLLLCGLSRLGVGDQGDDRDPVPLGDGLAEASGPVHCGGSYSTTTCRSGARPSSARGTPKSPTGSAPWANRGRSS